MSITPEQYAENPLAYAPRAVRETYRPPIKDTSHASTDGDQRVTAADVLEARYQQALLSCRTAGIPPPHETFEQFVEHERAIDARTEVEHQRLVALCEGEGLPVSEYFEMPRAPNLTALARLVLPTYGLMDARNVTWLQPDQPIPESAATWIYQYGAKIAPECGD